MTTALASRLAAVVDLIAQASRPELLKRAFFQLVDDLSSLDADQLTTLVPPIGTLGRDRAALVAAAFAHRFDELEVDLPEWLASDSLVATQPVFLTSGLDDLIRRQTPPSVSRHNVFVDRSSLQTI